jgi:hypothetical protein
MRVIVTRLGPEGVQDVTRGTPLGNRFVLRHEYQRDEVCDRYEVWFAEQVRQRTPAVMDQLNELWIVGKQSGGVLRLGCHCAPRRCHARTIARFLETYAGPD